MIKIGIVTMAYNEERILPYFLRHYSYVDRIHVLYETDSTDRTREILEAAPNVEIQDIHIEGGLVDEEKVKLVNQAIRDIGMLDEIDWIYVLDPDEFIYPEGHEDPRKFLMRQEGNIIFAHMWQVYRHWSDKNLDPAKFPLGQRQHGDPDLYNQVESTHKDKNANSIKPSVIRAGVPVELLPGNHRINGQANAGGDIFRGVHWQMADPEIAVERRMARKFRISNHNRKLRHGFQHFEVTPEIIGCQCDDHQNDPLLPIFYIPNLSFLKYLSLEINDLCPLTDVHPQCPRNHDRFAGRPDQRPQPSDFIDFAKICMDYGFDGLITLHNYNEPMATTGIVKQMAVEFPKRISLWTSGVFLDPVRDAGLITLCHNVIITRYPGVKIKDLSQFSNIKYQEYGLDGRSDIVEIDYRKIIAHTCTRPNWEIIVDCRGYINMCCGDWRNRMSIGNIMTEDHHVLLHKWNQKRKEIINLSPWDTEDKFKKLPRACQVCLSRKTVIPMA